MSTGQGNPRDLIKGWNTRDWMVVGGGLVVFVFSFFDYVGVSGPYPGVNYPSISAWHSYAVLGLLLVLASSVVWALQAAKRMTLPALPAKFEIIAAAAAGLGTLLILIRGLTYSTSFAGVSVGLHFGGIVVIIAGAVVTAGAAWAFVLGGGSLKQPFGNTSGSAKGFGSPGAGRAPTPPPGPGWSPPPSGPGWSAPPSQGPTPPPQAMPTPPPQGPTPPPQAMPTSPPQGPTPPPQAMPTSPPQATPTPPPGEGFGPPPASRAPSPPPFAPPPAPPGAPAEHETPPE